MYTFSPQDWNEIFEVAKISNLLLSASANLNFEWSITSMIFSNSKALGISNVFSERTFEVSKLYGLVKYFLKVRDFLRIKFNMKNTKIKKVKIIKPGFSGSKT